MAIRPLSWLFPGAGDLADGRLVRPFEQASSRGYAYCLVCPEHRRQQPKIKWFREWLCGQVKQQVDAFAAER